MENKLEVNRGERLHQCRQELLTICASAVESAYRMGQIMKEIRDKELWRGSYESFGAFYSDPELGFETSSVYRAIKMVELFPKKERLGRVPLRKINLILPHITEENKEELLTKAETLSTGDLCHELVVKKMGIKEEDKTYFPKTYPCPKCKKLKGITFDDLCHCGWTKEQIDHVSKVIDAIQMGEEGQEDIPLEPPDESEEV